MAIIIALLAFVCVVSVFNSVLLTVIILEKKSQSLPLTPKVFNPNPAPVIAKEVGVGQTFPVLRVAKDKGDEARVKEALIRQEEMKREFSELYE